MNKLLVIIAAILGILFIVLGAVYLTMPASSLPSFLPGYASKTTTHIHYTHAVASLLLGVACFIFAWFQSGKKKGPKEPSVKEEKN